MKFLLILISMICTHSIAQAQHRLEFRPKVGTVVHGHMNMDMEMSIMGKDMKNLMHTYITYTIDSVDANGNVTVTHKVDSILINVVAEGDQIDLNSNIPSTYEGNPQFAPLMSTVGQSFTNIFDQYGKLLTVEENSLGNYAPTLFIEYLPLDKKNSWELESVTEIGGMKVKSMIDYTWKKEEAGKVYLDCKSKASVMGMKIIAPSEVIVDAQSGIVLSNIGSSQNNMMGMKMKTDITYIATVE